MVARVDALVPKLLPGIEVEQITPATVDTYLDTFLAAWSMPPALREDIGPDVRLQLKTDPLDTQFFVARHAGRPAGAGVLMIFPRSGYLMGSAVVPALRGKGVYHGLLARRLEVLRARGVPLITIQATRTTSAPICTRLGVETVCTLSRFEWREQK
jgi:GNAT superfamily N-acetyltransferase